MAEQEIMIGPRGPKPRKTFSRRNIFLYGTLAFIAVYYAIPLYVMTVTSLKGMPEIRLGNIFSPGTHTGGGYFGPPTGKRFVIRAIADCAAINNQINDEWLIRDTAGLVLQLGLDPKEFARDLIVREGGTERCVTPFSPAVDVQGPYKSRGNENEWGERLSDILRRMMEKDFSVIRAEYDRAVQTEHPGSTTVHSWADTEKLWMGLRASFPSAEFSVDHQIGREDPMLSPRAAVRWSLNGTHDGWGMFGQPTGAQIHVMGFTHAEFGPYGLRREFTLFDPVSIWKQIFIATGSA